MGIAQVILLIMSLIGALPEFIAALEKLWAWIKSVRDPKQRRAFKREWVSVAMHGVDQKKPQPRTALAVTESVSKLEALQRDVLVAIGKQMADDGASMKTLVATA